MSEMSMYILLTGVINLTLLLFLRKNGSLLVIIELWWFLWIFISSLSLSGLDIPSDETYLFFLIMLCSITVGAYLYALVSDKKKIVIKNYSVTLNYDRIYIICMYLMYLVAPLIVFFFIKSISVLLSLDSAEHFRGMVFGVESNGKNIIFPHAIWKILTLNIADIIVLASYFIGSAFYIVNGKKSLMIISAGLFILKGGIMLGRGELYLILLMSIIIYFYRTGLNFYKLFNWKFFVIGSALLSIILFIGHIRDNNEFDIVHVLYKYLIEYHTCGIIIFNQDFSSEHTFLSDTTTYGRVLFSSIEYLLSFIINGIGLHIDPMADILGTTLDEARVLGYNEYGFPLIYNAFGTVFYATYLDGGIILSGIFALLYGFFMVKLTVINNLSKSVYSISVALSMSFLGFFGLFMPGELPRFVFVLFIIVFVFKIVSIREAKRFRNLKSKL